MDDLFTAVIDRHGVVRHADAAATRLLGAEPGVDLAELVAPEHRAALAAALAAAPAAPAALAGSPPAPAAPRCGRRPDGLPWVAAVCVETMPPLGDDRLLVGGRRFGPVQWFGADDEASPGPPPGPLGLDSVVSHDIRGALRTGSGFVSVVKRLLAEPDLQALDERLAQAAERLEVAAHSLANADALAAAVVDHLRWAARPLVVRSRPLANLVTAAAAEANARAPGPVPPVEVAGDLPDVVADGELVQWAIGELVVNAAKFAPPDVAITVTAEPVAEGRYTVVSVRDHGSGIDRALLDDAFLPGRKLQARGDHPGVGMGLALCRLVFERHGGWCRADAPAGPGTLVRFRLPLAA
jgi:hypothetical protein